jgi:hypothetical protein
MEPFRYITSQKIPPATTMMYNLGVVLETILCTVLKGKGHG